MCWNQPIFVSRLVGFFLRSDRPACVRLIKQVGVQKYADNMAKQKLQSIRRGTAGR